ncbi:type I secretion system permease/ATPase [Arcobacter sp. 15-2]|uniref:type I secretion system permease/ATPase n=1 Tax=Arcobacter sp. 15-2 TaxID=3374109 RepID=UPI00399CC15C
MNEQKKVAKNSEFQSDPLLIATKFILDFYYGDISLETISSFTPKTQNGFDENCVSEVISNLGLYSIKKDITADEIPSYFLPCIIFDAENHPMVYLKKDGKNAYLYDPYEKIEKKIEKNLLKKYVQAIIIFRDEKKKEYIDKEKKKSWFFDPVKSFWRSYIEIGILTFFINLFALAVPLFTMSVYDRVVPNSAFETLFVLSLGVGVILIFDLIFKSVRNYIIEKTGKKLGLHLEEELMKRVLLIQTQYDDMMTGSKANLFRELQQVREFFATRSLVQVIDFPFFFIALFVIFLISPAVAAVPTIAAILILIFNVLLQIPISNLSAKNLENMQSKQSYLVESIQGSQSIKLTNATSTKLFNWRNIVAFSDAISLRIQSLNALSMNLSQTVIQLVTMFVIVVGVFEIAAKNLSVGGLIAVTILASRAMVPVINVSMMVIRFKEINESINTINNFWHLPIESQKELEVGIGKLKGQIEFKDVDFFFKDSKYPSLDKVSFKINKGEKVGIIGQTGAGKSTLLKLLTGLYTPTSGSIYFDGHDTSTMHPVEIRQNIGVMPQEPFLFNGSLKENIELSRPISKEKMMELISITGLEELVKKSGKGDGLQVGERGSNLSTGQRQLVAMARAILNDPSMLILDEPTSGLDVGLEKTLINQLKSVIATDKTVIVITHRFSALDLVDRVIVLSQGKIVADGPKEKILAALSGNNKKANI